MFTMCRCKLTNTNLFPLLFEALLSLPICFCSPFRLFLFGPLTHLSSQFALCLSVKYFLPSQNHLAALLSCLWALISSARLTFCIRLKPSTTHTDSQGHRHRLGAVPVSRQRVCFIGQTWHKCQELMH